MYAFLKSLLCFVICLVLSCGVFAADAQTLYNTQYCFSASDFRTQENELIDGIFITAVPDASIAALQLGDRAIRVGDVLSAQSLDQLRLIPHCQENQTAVLSYQPICGASLLAPAQLTIRIQSGKNETPTVYDVSLQTYKNIANNGMLSATDPEGGTMTYQLVDQPKFGDVTLSSDGSFIYTPHTNKVGQDHFTYTASDDAGNISKPATVKIEILAPTDKMSFADMDGSNEHFEAIWMRQSGLYGGKSIGAQSYFLPHQSVSRGEFLVMAMELMDIERQDAQASFPDSDAAPVWMQPYLATAAKLGLVHGKEVNGVLCFCPNDPISGREAAVMLQNMLALPIPAATTSNAQPVWAQKAVMALTDLGIRADYSENKLNYAQAADLLYQISSLA